MKLARSAMNIRIPAIIILSLFLFSPATSQTGPVKIGLLIQDSATPAAKQAAELAVSMVNDKGGINGHPVQLITRSMEGPWGTGSKQAVDLIFEEQVWALLGSHDGRNAHLVEQAATKSTVVFISAWASDPTLSQAFVPWFYTCVPNDLQQADALIQEIFIRRNLARVAVVTDDSYESNQAMKSLRQRIKQSGRREPVEVSFNKHAASLNALHEQIRQSECKGIILLCRPSASLQILRQLRQTNNNLPVFCSLSVLNENEVPGQALQDFSNTLSVRSDTWSASKEKAFRLAYQKAYGKWPGMVAMYAFDGMNVLMEAIRISGSPEREKIQEALSKLNFEGVTGQIRFDERGNRSGKLEVLPVIFN